MLIDSHDIRQYLPEDLRRNISYMAQDAELFDDTILENLRLGNEDASQEALERAVIAAGVQDFVARHPSGYGFRVGPRGRALSGGERQAVSLARALVRDAPILVLDEPTAAMDNQLEYQLVERLKPLVTGKTLILCTHRAPTLALVDRVIWLDQGRIMADGPTREVLAKLSGGGAAATPSTTPTTTSGPVPTRPGLQAVKTG